MRMGLAVLDLGLVPARELLDHCLVWQVGSALKYYLQDQVKGPRRKVNMEGVNLITDMVDARAHGSEGSMYKAEGAERLLLELELMDHVDQNGEHGIRLTEQAFASLKSGFPVNRPTPITALELQQAGAEESTRMTVLELACRFRGRKTNINIYILVQISCVFGADVHNFRCGCP